MRADWPLIAFKKLNYIDWGFTASPDCLYEDLMHNVCTWMRQLNLMHPDLNPFDLLRRVRLALLIRSLNKKACLGLSLCLQKQQNNRFCYISEVHTNLLLVPCRLRGCCQESESFLVLKCDQRGICVQLAQENEKMWRGGVTESIVWSIVQSGL